MQIASGDVDEERVGIDVARARVAVVSPFLCTTSKVSLFVNPQSVLSPAAADPMPA